jgi:hypothetical protein
VAIDDMTSRRRRASGVSRSVHRTPEHRGEVYRRRRAEHESRERRRRRREVPTYADAAVEILTGLLVGGGFGFLAWTSWTSWPSEVTAVVCAVLALAFTWSGLRPLCALVVRRHPAQVAMRERCSVCGGLFMPGRRARRHIRRERRSVRGPVRSTLVRVR